MTKEQKENLFNDVAVGVISTLVSKMGTHEGENYLESNRIKGGYISNEDFIVTYALKVAQKAVEKKKEILGIDDKLPF